MCLGLMFCVPRFGSVERSFQLAIEQRKKYLISYLFYSRHIQQ
jgi:hypothetical protein